MLLGFFLSSLWTCCSVVVASEISGGKYALRQFMNWYFPSSGVWQGHLSYPPDWCRANGIEALANYYLYNEMILSQEDKDYLWGIFLDVKRNQGNSFYQTADYFDDILWWSLAYTRVYEIAVNRGDSATANYFLNTAKEINDVVARDSWSTDVCAGGVFWSRDFLYKNAITNELYLTSSARLAFITKEARFTDRAILTMDWFLLSGMIQQSSDSLIVDGLDNSCKPTGNKYTYNQGVILGGIVEYNRLLPNETLLQLGERIASSVSQFMTNSNGILTETSCGDGALFKGIYARYLRYFISNSETSKGDDFNSFLVNQSLSVWNHDRDVLNGYFGKSWAGPYDYNFHNLQISALDLFGAVDPLTVSEHEGEQCNKKGIWTINGCACFARYSGQYCDQSTSWANYYQNQIISFSSLSANSLLCVAESGVVSTCLSDSLASSTYLTVQDESSSFSESFCLKSNWGTYLIVANGTVTAVSVPSSDLNSNKSIYFTAEVDESYSHPLSLEAVRIKAYDGSYLVASTNYVTAISSRDSATLFLTNLKQQCP